MIFAVVSRQTPFCFEKPLADITVSGRIVRLLVFRYNVPQESRLRCKRYTAFTAVRSWRMQTPRWYPRVRHYKFISSYILYNATVITLYGNKSLFEAASNE